MFNPPIGNTKFPNIEGVSGPAFKVNANGDNPYTRVDLFAINNWPNINEETVQLYAEAYKDLGSGDSADAYFYIWTNIEEIDGDPTGYLLLAANDRDNNFVYHELNTETDNTYYWLIDSNPYIRVDNGDAYLKIFPTSIIFNDGTTDAAIFSSTSINIRDGTVPVYYGESATEPATYTAGDTWYDTSSTGELKMYITSVGWITIGTP